MYTDAFFEDCKKLNIKKPEIVVPATSLIDEYISHLKENYDKENSILTNKVDITSENLMINEDIQHVLDELMDKLNDEN